MSANMKINKSLSGCDVFAQEIQLEKQSGRWFMEGGMRAMNRTNVEELWS